MVFFEEPVRLKKTGVVSASSLYGITINWIDGTQSILPYARIPQGLKALSKGAYFEADLLYDMADDRAYEIVDWCPSTYRELTDEELEEFVSSLPSSNDLPRTKI